jgi:hypothetical protein
VIVIVDGEKVSIPSLSTSIAQLLLNRDPRDRHDLMPRFH